MAQELKVSTRQVPEATTLDLQGDLTGLADADLMRAYHAAVASGAANLVLNFVGTEYINSAGIGIIISLLTEARAAGVTLVICGLSPHYQKIFRMVGLTQYAEVFETEAAAIEDLMSRGSGASATL
ncbi:MAG: STAS domain-containing protein [Chloroflexia bacterium]